MLNPRLKITIKNSILKALFEKEEAAIQSKIDEILDELTLNQIGHFYRYKHNEYGRTNVRVQMKPLELTESTLPKAEDIRSWRLEKAAMRTAMSNYIITALNICTNITECKLIFPNHIQDTLKNVPATAKVLQEKNQQKIISFRKDHAIEEQHMREQYMKNMVL